MNEYPKYAANTETLRDTDLVSRFVGQQDTLAQ